jgi:solute carrier family 8 (sodium/calcium exchanger)
VISICDSSIHTSLILSVDEHFSVKLSNLKIKDNQGRLTPGIFDKTVQLVEPSTAVVMIIDDDHAGMFVFENEERTVVEADGRIEIKVLRTSGARGCIRVPFATEDETATSGRDYIAHSGEVFFENNENEYVYLRSLCSTSRFSPLSLSL